jgi:transposase-like protein
MAKDHRRTGAELVQGVMLDDPNFLHEIVERVVQHLLEAEMSEHRLQCCTDARLPEEPEG